jgi:tRNA modification GTPase
MKLEQTATTVAAVLTPTGRSAIATVEVCGPGAIDIVSSLCSTAIPGPAAPAARGSLCVRRWGGANGEPVVLHSAAHNRVLIHPHGGELAVRRILHDLAILGVSTVPWPDLMLHKGCAPIQVEATKAMTQCVTLRTAAILLDQFHGALDRTLRGLLDCLTDGREADVAAGLSQLMDRSRFGLHLVEPWRVAIVGQPNVGKSSLLNALVGFDRAIVDAVAGTTRDLVTTITAIEGWPVQLCDSAGIRSAGDALEQAGVVLSERAIAGSDCQLVVLDRSRQWAPADLQILKSCPRPIVVANKADLAAQWDPGAQFADPVAVSAKGGIGLELLLERIGATLVPEPPPPGMAVPFTQTQVQLIATAYERALTGDFAGVRLRLGELLGQGDA